MKNFHPIVRSVLACVAVSTALASANAWADLTAAQAVSLEEKVEAGDKAALTTLMTEAQQGNQYAQYCLGMLYALGEGVPQDYKQAAQWWRKAAEQGFADAQFNLGALYADGQGVPQDYNQAAQWYRKAAEQGNASAQFNLGVLYANGQGVPRNKVVAYALFNLSMAGMKLGFSSGNQTVSDTHSKLVNGMTAQEIEAGRALSRQMSVPGNFLKALDGYLAAPGSKGR